MPSDSLTLDELEIDKCYKLEKTGEYLGKLNQKRYFGREIPENFTGVFIKDGKYLYRPLKDWDNSRKDFMYIEVPCESSGGRRRRHRKSRKSHRKHRRTTRRH